VPQWRIAHAPAKAEYFAEKIQWLAYGVEANVPGMNIISPLAPDPPKFRITARSPDSQRAMASCNRKLTR
jgi:hypothetical protein